MSQGKAEEEVHFHDVFSFGSRSEGSKSFLKKFECLVSRRQYRLPIRASCSHPVISAAVILIENVLNSHTRDLFQSRQLLCLRRLIIALDLIDTVTKFSVLSSHRIISHTFLVFLVIPG